MVYLIDPAAWCGFVLSFLSNGLIYRKRPDLNVFTFVLTLKNYLLNYFNCITHLSDQQQQQQQNNNNKK